MMDSPAMVADAWAAGLWAERRPTTPVSAIKNLLSVLIKRYYSGLNTPPRRLHAINETAVPVRAGRRARRARRGRQQRGGDSNRRPYVPLRRFLARNSPAVLASMRRPVCVKSKIRCLLLSPCYEEGP